jgi:hypothetical protein
MLNKPPNTYILIHEQVQFHSLIVKINRKNTPQPRQLIITESKIYNVKDE